MKSNLKNSIKLLPILCLVVLTVACGNNKGPTSKTNAANAVAAPNTLEGNWYSPCVTLSSSSSYRTMMSFSSASGRVSTSYPSYSGPSCATYSGNASSPTSGSFTTGASLNGVGGIVNGTSLNIVDAYGTTNYYSYSFSGGQLVLQRISMSQYGVSLNGSPVNYTR